jgi:hypothetical protein
MKKELYIDKNPGIVEWVRANNVECRIRKISFCGPAATISSIEVEIQDDSPMAMLFVLKWS